MDEAGPEGPQTSSNPAMIPKEPADLVPAASTASVAAPVKMRERPRRGLPRPSGYDIVNTFSKENRTSVESPKVSPASVASSPGLFQRNMKFFLSFNKKQRRRSSTNSNFSAPYLRRSQSTKGQIISKCPFGVIVWTKIPPKKFDNFCPGGQIK